MYIDISNLVHVQIYSSYIKRLLNRYIQNACQPAAANNIIRPIASRISRTEYTQLPIILIEKKIKITYSGCSIPAAWSEYNMIFTSD
jgi:UDP-N-acetylglucosamine pyrophosphorylase